MNEEETKKMMNAILNCQKFMDNFVTNLSNFEKGITEEYPDHYKGLLASIACAIVNTVELYCRDNNLEKEVEKLMAINNSLREVSKVSEEDKILH